MIELREINRDNFSAVLELSVFDGQKDYIASNCYSLAQAKAQSECVPLAIYSNDELVGFVMYCMDYEDSEYWIYRLMIDKKHQKKGYGKIALLKILEILKQDKEHSKVYLSFEPENETAKKLYEQLGFVPDGRIVCGEIVYCLDYAIQS
ncbi:MAG: GNAT family N-acetyltransferase [Defluviitaleaceae bacterium]|nr:GNAT family N-acetyltransferase [Defluviitaleaceae bacterium]